MLKEIQMPKGKGFPPKKGKKDDKAKGKFNPKEFFAKKKKGKAKK